MVGVFHEGADELLGMVSRAACGLQIKGIKLMCGYQFKLGLLGSLGQVTGAGTGCGNVARAGRERSDKGGDAVFDHTHKVHAGMFNLIVHHTGEAWDGLLNCKPWWRCTSE